jgi:hypothetical protein
MPSRNVSVTAHCHVCGGPLPAGRPRTTCSDGCRQKAWRLRHQPPQSTAPQLPAAQPRKDHTFYQCPTCDARLLGSQFCEDCHTFMRRLGPGGLTPCCGDPVTFEELLGT